MAFDDYSQQPQQDPSTDNASADNADILDPVKKLGLLDKTLDKAFSQVLTKMNENSDTVANAVNNINLKDFAKAYKSNTKEEKNVQEQLRSEMQGLDESILSQFENLAVPKERLERYKQYKQLPYELYLATRMMQVYMDNILIKNPYTKQFIDILSSEVLEQDNSVSDSDKQVLLKITKAIFAFFDIQKRLKNDILPKQLILGNFFVEIINLNKFANIEKQPGSMQILTEQFADYRNASTEYHSHKYDIKVKFDLSNLYLEHLQGSAHQAVASTEPDFDRQIKLLMESRQADIGYESRLLFEDINEENTLESSIQHIRSLDVSQIKNINLKYISPENVIILEKNGNKYGYLIIDGKKERSSTVNGNGTETFNFAKTINNAFGSAGSSDADEKQKNDVTDTILKQIFKKIKNEHNIDKVSDLLNIISNDHVSHALKSVLYDMYSKYSQVSIRYVPNESLINFTNPIDKYAPYGTSIFDTVLFPARLYLIGLLSSVISRMNRASVVRKWTIEAGSHRNHGELIEKFKRELKNQTVSFQDMMKLKDISQSVSDYKDFVTISQDGKRFVDLEILPMHDRSLPMNELDTLKADLISASGIPSPMLGITDTYDLREQIVNVNIIFATKIDSFQTFINESLEELVNGVLRQLFILNGKKYEFVSISKYIDVKLNPPLVLVLQHLESTLSSATNIINLLNQVNMPADPTWMLKRFIKIIDWDAVKQAGLKFQKEQQLQQTIQQEVSQALQPQQGAGGGY